MARCELLINADDLGMTPGVTDGIIAAIDHGCVGTTSAMMGDPNQHETIAAEVRRLAGRVGVHLQLTDGTSVRAAKDIPGLVDAEGRFPRRPGRNAAYDAAQVLDEWRAQLGVARELGIRPAHIDTHHDVHWCEGAFDAYVQLAIEEDLPCRSGPAWLTSRLRRAGVRCRHYCETFGDEGDISVDGLIRRLLLMAAACPDGSRLELACHPGRVDDALRLRSRYVERREEELRVLCSPGLADRLQDAGIMLTSQPCG
jgi:hypothetical protein